MYGETKGMVTKRINYRQEYAPQSYESQMENHTFLGAQKLQDMELKADERKRQDRMEKYTIRLKKTEDNIVEEESQRQRTLDNKDKKKARKKILATESELLAAEVQEEQTERSALLNEWTLGSKVNNMHLSPNIIGKFTPSYMGANFAEVKGIMEDILRVADALKQNPGVYATLRTQNIINYDFEEFKEKCLTAFHTSLEIHGLRYGQDGQLSIIPEYKDYINTESLGERLGSELKDITDVFRNAEYEKEKRIVSTFSKQVLENEKEKFTEILQRVERNGMSDASQADIEDGNIIKTLNIRLQQEEAGIIEQQELLNSLIDDYQNVSALILLETERITELKNRQKEFIANHSNYDLIDHLEDEFIRLRKRIAAIGEEKREILGILEKINRGEVLEEHQKDYLAMFYGATYEVEAEPQQVEIVPRDMAELQQAVIDMSERLHTCRTKKDFLTIREEVCTLASELEQMILEKIGTEDDFYKSEGIWKLKVNQVLFAAKKARALYLISKANRDKLAGHRILTEEEVSSIRERKRGTQILDSDSEQDIGFYDIVEYAKASYNTAELYMHRARMEFMNEEQTRSLLKEATKQDIQYGDVSHEEFDRSVKAVAWTKERIEKCQKSYEEKKEELKVLAERIAQIEDETERATQQKALKSLILRDPELTDYEIYKKLNKSYYLYGEDGMVAGTMLRNSAIIDGLPVFAKLSSNEIRDILGKMSVGVFEKEEKNPVLQTAYRELNEEGLRLYKEKIYEHYDYLCKKYGFEYPNIEFSVEHYMEWKIDFSSITFDGDLIEKISGFYDENNMKDKILEKTLSIYEKIYRTYNEKMKAYYTENPDVGGQFSPEKVHQELELFWKNEVAPLVEELKVLRAQENSN